MPLFIKPYRSLTLDELYAILRLRSEVFVVEQDCVYLDLDGTDAKSVHVFAMEGERCVGCLRVFMRDADTVQIGRVVVSQDKRGTGLGRELMEEAIRVVGESFGEAKAACLEAQCYATGFYERFGFVITSEPFYEDGILHVQMMTRILK